jgi:hypothetical protein
VISRIHQKLGTAGFVISIVALVLALSGAAYAAGALTGKQKKEVEKIAKKYAGKPGAPGAAGPAGPAGPAGAKGDTGAQGAQGKEGPIGKEGPQGKEGKEGKAGQTGFTATLPPGETETGYWGSNGKGEEFTNPIFTISYPIPLAENSEQVKYLDAEETEESVGSGGCELDIFDPDAAPVAPAGTLCVFTRIESLGKVAFVQQDTVAGTLIFGATEADGLWELAGTWAVTAAE